MIYLAETTLHLVETIFHSGFELVDSGIHSGFELVDSGIYVEFELGGIPDLALSLELR